MPKITQRSLEQNWYRIHKNKILNVIRKYRPEQFKTHYTEVVGPKPTLAELLIVVASIKSKDVPKDPVEPRRDEDFVRLLQALDLLNNQFEVKIEILALLENSKLKAQLASLKASDEKFFSMMDEHKEAEGIGEEDRILPAPAAADPVAPTKSPYKQGFELAAKKREAAKKNRQKWFLDHQLNQLKELMNLAWWGKMRAVMYGLAVGIAMAGFMLMFLQGAVGTAAMAIMGFTLVPFLAYFPAKANFWITRRDPSELSFDLFSPHEPEQKERPVNDGWSDRTYRFLNTPLWGYTVKELLARIGGLLNATVYGGLTATGMWELLSEFGLNQLFSSFAFTIGSTTIPYAAIPCAIITFAMSRMVFKPELGLGVKFIRGWLNKNPVQSFIDMNNKVNPEGKLSNPYFMRFALLFSSIVIGGVFTTLAAADLVGSLTGGAGWIIKMGLSVLTISVVPFYYQKAIDNVLKEHAKDAAKRDGVIKEPEPKNKESRYLDNPWLVRRLNAFVHSVPPFLGGLVTFAGIGGIFFGIFTGLAGFGASFISGENGEEEGYENEIQNEINETTLALQAHPAEEWDTEVPDIQMEGEGVQPVIKATKQPYLLNFCNMSKETEDAALDLLEGRIPDLSTKQKIA